MACLTPFGLDDGIEKYLTYISIKSSAFSDYESIILNIKSQPRSTLHQIRKYIFSAFITEAFGERKLIWGLVEYNGHRQGI